MTERVFKAIVIGDTQVGKSSLMMLITCEKKETKPTIGVEMKIKSLVIQDKHYKITIFDTAGHERFRTVTSSYYRGSHLVFLVYDVTNRKTFEDTKVWLLDFKTTFYNSDGCSPYITLIGNKIDMKDQRVVSQDEGEMLRKELELDAFYEVSVEKEIGVMEAFENAVTCYALREAQQRELSTGPLKATIALHSSPKSTSQTSMSQIHTVNRVPSRCSQSCMIG
ncbi:hypothetical protein C9374_013953 [Naegleria lovaniensis]|uniref:Rab family small GTPase n=1 Tax=Naegleria lovaniensis TaxID=51637 RepID=A0AA88KPF2_NAELO|nr:uncharacterized protein C9374_013953 [Naegleria lovaniensis]KAG2389393.1 hypothetical protein C9374_013953 [Naegleria lovaniensis]